MRYGAYGLILAAFLCAFGALLIFAFYPADVYPVLLWALLLMIIPSLLAGIFLARFLEFRERVKHMGSDPLTGLHGEPKLLDNLKVEFERAKRLSKRTGVVIMALDSRERFGVPEYVAWKAAANLLKRVVRISDSTYVLGPGRFAVLLSATNEEGGRVVIDRLRAAVREVNELFGVKIRFGQNITNPGEPGPSAHSVVEMALADAAQALAETTLPALPQQVKPT